MVEYAFALLKCRVNKSSGSSVCLIIDIVNIDKSK